MSAACAKPDEHVSHASQSRSSRPYVVRGSGPFLAVHVSHASQSRVQDMESRSWMHALNIPRNRDGIGDASLPVAREAQCINYVMLFGNGKGWWTSSPSRTTEDRGREGRLPPSTHAACPLPPLYAGDTLNSCVLLTAPSTGAFDPSSIILPITLSRQEQKQRQLLRR
jgi:hypothetical protein